jgi:hypothetical protein
MTLKANVKEGKKLRKTIDAKLKQEIIEKCECAANRCALVCRFIKSSLTKKRMELKSLLLLDNAPDHEPKSVNFGC